jgi:hypothetical protein
VLVITAGVLVTPTSSAAATVGVANIAGREAALPNGSGGGRGPSKTAGLMVVAEVKASAVAALATCKPAAAAAAAAADDADIPVAKVSIVSQAAVCKCEAAADDEDAAAAADLVNSMLSQGRSSPGNVSSERGAALPLPL